MTLQTKYIYFMLWDDDNVSDVVIVSTIAYYEYAQLHKVIIKLSSIR